MMLAVTVATMSFLGQEEVTPAWYYHETDTGKVRVQEEMSTEYGQKKLQSISL